MDRGKVKWKTAVLLVCAGVLGLILILGCGDDTARVEPEPEEPMRDSHDHLLDWYVYAMEHEDGDMYEEALHDCFLFVFPPSVADSLGLPPGSPWWGKTAEVRAMRNLFADPTIREIELEFVDKESWEAGQYEIHPDSTVTALFARTTPVMHLIIQEPGQEQKVVTFDQTYLDVVVVRDPLFPDMNLFVFARMEEVPKLPEDIRCDGSHNAVETGAHR